MKALRQRRWLIRGGIALVALIVVVVAVASAGGDDEGDGGAVTDAQLPTILSEGELRSAAEDSEFPIYWAGPMQGTQLELTLGSDGSALLRYLAEGVAVGGETAATTSIGTYPLNDPTAALSGETDKEGAIVETSDDGRLVVSNESNPNSVYFANPDNTVQVEVYDPSSEKALRLALSDQVRPVE